MTFENSIVPVAGTAPRFSSNMTGIIFGRFCLVEKFKALVVVNRENQDIYFVRLA